MTVYDFCTNTLHKNVVIKKKLNETSVQTKDTKYNELD